MRTRYGLLVPMLMCLSFAAWAQNAPKAEVFGGFSILRVGTFDESQTAYGWQASVAGNVTPVLGLVADFGGQYKSIDDVKVHAYEYLFGPRLNVRRQQASAFVHALIGGANVGGDGESENGLALGIGGGVDIKVGERVAFRLFQIDWIPTRFEGEWSNDSVRFGIGIVFKGGQ